MKLGINSVPLLLASTLMLHGCAGIVSGTQQATQLDTRLPDGRLVTGADCVWRNDREQAPFKSGTKVQVRRSAADLEIRCTYPSYPDAFAKATSRANAQMAGNAFFLFGVGAIVDHQRGTGYTYPGWMQLVFSQTLVFDRKDEKDGEPVPPRPTDEKPESASDKANHDARP